MLLKNIVIGTLMAIYLRWRQLIIASPTKHGKEWPLSNKLSALSAKVGQAGRYV